MLYVFLDPQCSSSEKTSRFSLAVGHSPYEKKKANNTAALCKAQRLRRITFLSHSAAARKTSFFLAVGHSPYEATHSRFLCKHNASVCGFFSALLFAYASLDLASSASFAKPFCIVDSHVRKDLCGSSQHQPAFKPYMNLL